MTPGDVNSSETSGLLPSTLTDRDPRRKSTFRKLRVYFAKNLDSKWTELVLLACFFISGLIDSASYNAYQCFTSMQTGNTIFIALGVSNLPISSPNLAWTKSLASLLAFLLGSFLLAAFHRTFGFRTRGTLTASFLLQTVLIAISAALVRNGRTSGAPGEGSPPSSSSSSSSSPKIEFIPSDPGFPWADLIPIALLAFQASSKVITSRMLELNALPAVVLTTLYSDLISDSKLFTAGLGFTITTSATKKNSDREDGSKRNQRLASVLVYFLGAVLGGVSASTSVGFTGALIGAAVLQAGLALLWVLWKEESKVEEEEIG